VKRRIFLYLIIALGGVLMITNQVMAGEQIGTFCWQWTPYIDLLEFAVTDEGDGIYLLVGEDEAWIYYTLPCVGSAILIGGVYGPAQIKMGLHCTNDTGYFGGINDCVFKSTLDPVTLSGPVEVDCGNGGFTNTGILVPIDCDIASPEADGSVGGQ